MHISANGCTSNLTETIIIIIAAPDTGIVDDACVEV